MNSQTLHTDDPHSGNPDTLAFFGFVALRIGLGLFFCIAGISKLFILSGFSDTIRQLFPALAPVSPLIAAFIIGIEILCGAGLLLNTAVRPCTVVLGMLVTLFLYILADAVISQHAFICRCFGIIPMSFSNSGEFILNLVILDVLFFLYSRAGSVGRPAPRKNRWPVVVMTLIVLYGQISTATYLLDRDVSETPVNLQQINTYLSAQNHGNQIDRHNRHIVLLRLSDFNCPPCFDDFIGYSRLMQQYGGDVPGDVRIIGLVEQSGSMRDTLALQAWSAANDVRFRLFLVPDSIFLQFKIDKSCVVQQRPYGKVRFVYSFPGDEAGKKKLLADFRE